MCPGFDSRTRRHMWVEFVVGSLPCSEWFFSGCSGFPLSWKATISKSSSIWIIVKHFITSASDSSDRTPLNLHLHFFCYWFVPSQSWFVEGPVFRQARLFSNDNLVWQGEVTCGDLEVAMVTSFICILPALACLLSALLSINTQLTLQWRARWPHN